jgi:YihY family inner membrane protein
MNAITKIIRSIDEFQRKNLVFGFIYALVKKYGTDNASYLAALITYYGILSLFPLLIVFTTVSQLLLKNDAALRLKLSTSVSHYLPIIGTQLQHNIHSSSKTGLALIIGLLITLYGARGGASAVQYAMSSIWYVPQTKQPAFAKNILRSFGIIFAGGIGLMAATIISGYTTFLGHTIVTKVLALLISCIILWVTFICIIQLAIPIHKKIKQIMLGAAIAAIGLQILQTVGSALLAHELKSFNSTYGTFALVIGLMFWIYLQAEVILYAANVDVIRAYHLFPRSLQNPLTIADKRAYRRAARAQSRHKSEQLDIHFDETDA